MSSYHKLNEFLKKNNLKKENIIKSESYKYISNYFDKDHIYFSKILSMSLEKNPKMIRIRNDNFLIDAVEKKEKSILIVGFKYENKEKILIFSNEIYFDYNQSVRSSNSIITFNSDLFFNFFKNDNNGSMLKISKLNKEKINVSFYITDIDEIDEACFEEFITKKKECKIQIDSESIDNPSIPKKYKDEVFINFNNNNFECSLRFIDEKFCRCKLQKPYEKEDNQFHHFIPRNYFKKLYMNDSLKVLN